MNFICFNGETIPANKPVLPSNNRGFRYGEGLFETIKIIHSKIPLATFHFDRLLGGMNLLDFKASPDFSPQKLKSEIIALAKMNNSQDLAKARLTVFNGDGELYEERGLAQYIIECTALPPSINELNPEGLKIDVFPFGKKTNDHFSNLKSSNFLLYSLAATHARKNALDDCLLLNYSGTIADATIGNLFTIKDETITTPPLSDGCINGVMRRHLLENIPAAGYEIKEKSIGIADLESAEEIFLTNAIYGIRWVKQFQQKDFGNKHTKIIYQRLIKTIWE